MGGERPRADSALVLSRTISPSSAFAMSLRLLRMFDMPRWARPATSDRKTTAKTAALK